MAVGGFILPLDKRTNETNYRRASCCFAARISLFSNLSGYLLISLSDMKPSAVKLIAL